MYTVEQVLETMGGGRVLSTKLNISESNCSQWISNKRIPTKRAIQIFNLSKDLDLGLELEFMPLDI